MESNQVSVKILGVKIDKVDAASAYARFVRFMTEDGTLKMIFTPNAEFVMRAQKDPEFMQILNEGDMVIPDGIGVILASKIHGLGLTERVAGIEMMDRMLEYCHRTGKSIYLFGGKPGIAERAAEKINETYSNLKIKGVHNGYFSEKESLKILDDINEKKPDILIVALGAPKQEKWIYANRKLINARVAIGVGGALDVYAGVAKRAPKIFQRLGLEWLYRLLRYPTRIGRMMVLPHFLVKVIAAKFFRA